MSQDCFAMTWLSYGIDTIDTRACRWWQVHCCLH